MCPSSNEGKTPDDNTKALTESGVQVTYIYFPGLTESSDPDSGMVSDGYINTKWNHESHGAIGYIDGSARQQNGPNWYLESKHRSGVASTDFEIEVNSGSDDSGD